MSNSNGTVPKSVSVSSAKSVITASTKSANSSDAIDETFDSLSPVSIEELSEKEIENCVAKVVNNMVAGTQNFISTAKERVFGDTWWIPTDVREIIEIPKNATKKLITLKENHPYFALCQSDYNTGTVYQITMKWKDKRLSVIRLKQKQEARDYFAHLIQYNSLFRFIGK